MGHLFGTCFSTNTSIGLRYPGLAKIFLRKYIGSDLAPLLRHLHIIHFKNHFSAGVTNNAGTVIVFKLVEDIYVVLCEATTKLQSRVTGILFSGNHNEKEFSWVLAWLISLEEVMTKVFFDFEKIISNLSTAGGKQSKRFTKCRCVLTSGNFYTLN